MGARERGEQAEREENGRQDAQGADRSRIWTVKTDTTHT
jgi:hypothetical protein